MSTIAAAAERHLGQENKREKPGLKEWAELCFNCAIGLVFALINFPKLLQHIIWADIGNYRLRLSLIGSVQSVSSLVTNFSGSHPSDSYRAMMAYSFIGLFLYCILLAGFALRYRKLSYFGWGIFGIALGIMALHLISWIALILLIVTTFLVHIAAIAKYYIVAVALFLIRHVLLFLLIAGIAVILYVYQKYLLKAISAILAVICAGYILFRILPPLFQWLAAILRPIAQFVGMIFAFVFKYGSILFKIACLILGLIGIFCILGHLVVDQIKAAWYAGSGKKGILLSAFSIGTAFALIFLTSVANPSSRRSINTGWTASCQLVESKTGASALLNSVAKERPTDIFVNTMPFSVRKFVFDNLTAASTPIYDITMFILVLCVSFVGLFRRLFSKLAETPEDIPVMFYPKEYVMIFGGLITAVYLIFVQASQQNS